MPEPVVMKLGLYIMAPGPISTAYFINPSHQSVCLYVYPRLFWAGQLLVLLFDPEDGGNIFLQKACEFLTDYTTLNSGTILFIHFIITVLGTLGPLAVVSIIYRLGKVNESFHCS
jgi:hypothetical protein